MKRLAWYQNKAGYGSYTNINDVHYAYMKSKSGLGNLSVNHHERAVLTALGYTHPTLSYAWKQFYAAKTGLAVNLDYATLENAYYANNTYDFV